MPAMLSSHSTCQCRGFCRKHDAREGKRILSETNAKTTTQIINVTYKRTALSVDDT